MNSKLPVSEEFSSFGDELLLQSSAIHGVKPPDSQLFSEIISTEIEEMITSGGFSSLGYEEILFAIRLNAWHDFDLPGSLDVERIKFFGAFISPDFLSRVLKNYVTIRNFLDRKLKNFIDGF